MDGQGAVHPSAILDADIFDLAERAFDTYAEAVPFDNFGPYVIERSLGRGGMGEVFLAHDQMADRPVAIKFLYNLWSAPGLQERFAREIQNLARLEHPLIARLYDAGIHPCGAPYFAMEYVPGTALDVYCRERQSAVASRLHLFHLVCQAVEYAQTRLIVHCDLKPTNILVENDQVLKLVDFGVSRKLVALDQPANETQSVVGFTPLFAAPEQVRGEPVGLYTDVYALGVVLYQLLTGSLPGNIGSTAEAARFLASDQEPEKPSVVARKKGLYQGVSSSSWNDLDVLCLTALKKDPAQRYSSAQALTQDLEYYQARKPLAAQRDSFRYRLGKFVRRNRVPLAVAASIALLMASVITFFTLRLAHERDRANLETASSEAMNRFLAEDLLGQSDPFARGGSQQSLIDAVSQAAPHIDAQFSAQPLIAARLHRAVAEALENRSDFERARPQYLRAEELFKKADGLYSQDAIEVSLRRAALEATLSSPGVAVAKSTLASAESSMAHVASLRRDIPVALKFDRAVISLADNDLPAAYRDFSDALDAALTIPSFPPRKLLRLEETYAYACSRNGQPAKAEGLLRHVIGDYGSLGETDSPSVLRARIYLAQSLLMQRRYAEALTEANDIYPALVNKLGATHQAVMAILGTRAQAEGSMGLWSDAIRDDSIF